MMPAVASQPYALPAPPPPRRESAELSVVRLNMPLRWVAGIVMTVVGGVLSIGGVLWRTEAHIADQAVHVPADVSREGGPMSKRTLRQVLRAMTIQCDPAAAAGFKCRVQLPVEAD